VKAGPILLLGGVAAAVGLVLLSRSSSAKAGSAGSPDRCRELDQQVRDVSRQRLTDLLQKCQSGPPGDACKLIGELVPKVLAMPQIHCEDMDPALCRAKVGTLVSFLAQYQKPLMAACPKGGASPDPACAQLMAMGTEVAAIARTWEAECGSPEKTVTSREPTPLTLFAFMQAGPEGGMF
jgi:hypothetical protein